MAGLILINLDAGEKIVTRAEVSDAFAGHRTPLRFESKRNALNLLVPT
jgi:hypothetical protein